MSRQLLLLLALLASLASLATAFGGGAPYHRCSNLVPMHDTGPQTVTPPYELKVNATRYSPGDVIQVTLRSVGGARFLGFAITARRVSDGDTEELAGGFQVPANAQGGFWYNSNSSLPNCVTHDGNVYTEITVGWIAPAKSIGNVAFTTPVVASKSTFWANVTSEVVVAAVASEDPPFPPLTIGRSASPISGSCGVDYGCVRSPALCDPAICELLVKFIYLEAESRVRVELRAAGSYIALGLSDDAKMTDDLTLTCTSNTGGSGYSMQLGYNPLYRQLNERHRWTSLLEKYIELLDGNRIQCEFTLPLSINITTYANPRVGSGGPTNRTFDLRNPHYVFVAYGNTFSGSSSASQHSETPAISSGPVDLLSRGSYSAHRISGLRRAHGSVMLLAWQVLIPLGANLALFYRCLFMRSVRGVQLWFHLHRAFALSGLILTVVGLLLIFAQFGWRWSFMYATTQSHGGMGLSLLCLVVIQIVMGMLRPDKDAPRRPAFKIAHQTVGYTALGLVDAAIITIGFLSSLPQSYRTSHTVFAFTWLAFHVTFRIIMSVLQARWANKALNAVGESANVQEELEEHKLKVTKLLFVVFITGMLILFLAWIVTLLLF